MKKVVHDSRARLKKLAGIIKEHITTAHELAEIDGDPGAFEISDVKRDGNVRVKLKNEAKYSATCLKVGLQYQHIVSDDDGTFVYVYLNSVMLDEVQVVGDET